ncbi:uncharacterized protein [Littorina saxatilis]|uniref:uncharacterized protein n=1 Tax=Littorina saxatilis TaxID=31220 RepID=UPI0038B534FD
MEAQKENNVTRAGTQKLSKQKSAKVDQQKKSHRKSSLPNHVIDHRRVAQWLSDNSTDKDPSEQFRRSSEEGRNMIGNNDRVMTNGEVVEEVASKDDDLLKFAEILYKCTLCTTLPCILTSRPAFLEHVREHHLATRGPGIQCQNCHLHFHTHTDLLVHLSDSQCHSQMLETFQDSQCQKSLSGDSPCLSPKENYTFCQSLVKNEPDSQCVSSGESQCHLERENGSNSHSHSLSQRHSFQANNYHFQSQSHSSEEKHPVVLPPKENQNQCKPNPRLKSPPSDHDQDENDNFAADTEPPLLGQSISRCGFNDKRDNDDDDRAKSGSEAQARNSTQNPTTPHTAVEYHSNHHLNHLQMLTDQAMPSPPPSLLSHQQTDCSRRQLFNNSLPDGVNGFPSFTPEFGRFTKLIREGGKIVYFCQVCNVKCQVKAAFQVHCNGVRHHNHVNMASKNKLKVTSADLVTSRDVSFRTPLREVPVVGPQVTSPRQELTFMEKMDKLFQGHGDVSALFGRGRGLDIMGPSAGSRAESGFRSPVSVRSESRDSKDSRSEAFTPDKGNFSDKNYRMQRSFTPRSSPQLDFQPHRLCGPTEGRKEFNEEGTLKDGIVQTPDTEQSRNRNADDHGHTKRHSSEYSLTGADDEESSAAKRAKVDTPDTSTGQIDYNEQLHVRSNEESARTAATDPEEKKQQENTQNFDTQRRENITSELATITNHQNSAEKLQSAERLPSPYSGFSQVHDGQPVSMATMGKFPFSADPASCFYPRMLGEAWFHDARAVKTEPITWDGVGGATHDNEDVSMESIKGPNNEGWKVTMIRDVLKDVLAASSKGSSVSRDALLQHVSVVLRDANVLHWGPACNRAVRELFPHCLAQRKGKFKKTYFFSLCLLPGLDETRGDDQVDGLGFRPLRDMTQDLEQLLEHLPGLLFWSGEVSRGVSRDEVLHVLAARLSESEVYQWGMQCNKALRILFPLVVMKRKGKYKTYPFLWCDRGVYRSFHSRLCTRVVGL